MKQTLALVLPALLLACQQTTPGDGDSSDPDGNGTSGGPQGESLYPLVDGATWTYRHTNATGNVTGLEIVTMTASTWEGRSSFLLADAPDAANESTQSHIVREGTAALRIHKEVSVNSQPTMVVDYVPGFLRADDAWATTADQVGTERKYTRTETDGMGGEPKVDERSHIYRVLSLDEEVTVNAGTFSCVHVQRERTSGQLEGELVDYWYAPGIGKIKEHRDSELEGISEELLDEYAVPGR